MRLGLCLSLLLTLCSVSAHAFDPFSDARIRPRFALEGPDELRLILKGQVGLGLYDLEGEGGLQNDSTTDTVTLGTRSAFVALDAVRLALRLETPVDLSIYTAVAFEDGKAYAEGAWLDWDSAVSPWLRIHVETGLQLPFVGVDDFTHRAPLAARIYWGRPEVHTTVEVAGKHGAFRWWAGLSAAMMRPLGTEGVNDAATKQGTLAVLSYGDARPFSGNGGVFGAKLGLAVPHVSLEAFGFWGRLSAVQGTDELRNRMAHFALVPGYNAADPRDQDDTFLWGGGRLNLRWAGVEARVEAIASQESLIRRWTAYAQVGYAWQRTDAALAFLRTLEARVRVERYRILDAQEDLRVVDPSQALTWDWDVLTVALAAQLYGEILRLHVEYSLIAEENGSAGQGSVAFRNNELTAQLELRF
jgi:hypothetical protein